MESVWNLFAESNYMVWLFGIIGLALFSLYLFRLQSASEDSQNDWQIALIISIFSFVIAFSNL